MLAVQAELHSTMNSDRIASQPFQLIDRKLIGGHIISLGDMDQVVPDQEWVKEFRSGMFGSQWSSLMIGGVSRHLSFGSVD